MPVGYTGLHALAIEGCFSSYYEIEARQIDASGPRPLWSLTGQMDEVTAAPAGAGGLFVGVSLQSGEERSMTKPLSQQPINLP